jgi:hypothetical protein
MHRTASRLKAVLKTWCPLFRVPRLRGRTVRHNQVKRWVAPPYRQPPKGGTPNAVPVAGSPAIQAESNQINSIMANHSA